jgi:hypothetical protein
VVDVGDVKLDVPDGIQSRKDVRDVSSPTISVNLPTGLRLSSFLPHPPCLELWGQSDTVDLGVPRQVNMSPVPVKSLRRP